MCKSGKVSLLVFLLVQQYILKKKKILAYSLMCFLGIVLKIISFNFQVLFRRHVFMTVPFNIGEDNAYQRQLWNIDVLKDKKRKRLAFSCIYILLI